LYYLNNKVIQNLIFCIFKYTWDTIFFNSWDCLYYLRSVLWRYKLQFSKCEPYILNYLVDNFSENVNVDIKIKMLMNNCWVIQFQELKIWSLNIFKNSKFRYNCIIKEGKGAIMLGESLCIMYTTYYNITYDWRALYHNVGK